MRINIIKVYLPRITSNQRIREMWTLHLRDVSISRSDLTKRNVLVVSDGLFKGTKQEIVKSLMPQGKESDLQLTE